jgi:DNA-directed DNA polymerase III PolC
MKNQFYHLHIHSEYSVLKATGTVEKWHKAAEEKNIKGIAFTEWGNMASSMASYLESQKNENKIKTIFGLQILVVSDLHATVQEDAFILIAKNERGYNNLLKLSKYSWVIGYDKKRQTPRVNYDTLKQYKKGLYCLTGSMSGPIAVSLEAGYNIAERSVLQLKKIFGKNLRIEIQFNEFEEQKRLNQVLMRLADTHKIKCVLTNDCHYVYKGENKLVEFVQNIERLSIKHTKKEYSPISTEKWLKSCRQLNKTRKKYHLYITDDFFRKLIRNTNKIGKQCRVEIPIGKHCLPEYPIETHPFYQSWMKTNVDLFEHIAKIGFKEKVETKDLTREKLKEYRKRFDYEMEFIKNAHFVNYFLIIDDIVRYARSHNIEVGEARGSVAGSLVAYCMITNVDPLQFDLMFERFLNPGRISGERAKSADALPDIDLDFERLRRPDVKKYIIEKYGENRVCTIGTYQTLKLRSLIKDAHRVFEGLFPVTESKSELVDPNQYRLLIKELEKEDLDELKDAFNKSEQFKRFYKKFPYLVDFYFRNLDGQIRGSSRHAAAVLVTPTNITNWLPVKTQKLKEEGDERVLVSQWEDKFCERRGLLKLDILGIKTLNVFKMAKELIAKRHDRKIEFSKDVDLTDKKVIKYFDRGRTEGVFQFNSNLQSNYLKELDVTSFEDLITTNALLRPGPMDADAHKEYIELKAGKKKPKYDHESIKPFMERTFGLYVYQEDVMRTAHVLGGLSLAEADIMRSAMKKKDEEMMNQFAKKFIAGCTEKGLSQEKGESIWKKLLAFFAYGFNRCLHKHSMIRLANGKEKTLLWLYHKHLLGEEIWLKSYDSQLNTIINNKVKRVVFSGRRPVGYLKLLDGKNLTLTSRHGVGTDRGFRLFGQLRKDDEVKTVTKDSKEIILSPIDNEKTYYNETNLIDVYDIEMEEKPYNFFANGILVHNSHSASYAMIGFICQWLKVYYPLPFWTATLEFADDNKKKPENIWRFRDVILQEGIQFEKPLATRHRSGFYISKRDKIVWPIRAIKGIGPKAAKTIAETCAEKNPKTFLEFYESIPRRRVNKKVMNTLIAADALRNFGTQKQVAIEYYKDLRKEKTIPEMFEEPEGNTIYWEGLRDNVLGYMETSLRTRYAHWFSKKIIPISELRKIKNGNIVIVGGKIKRLFPYRTQKGLMYFITVYDIDGEFLLLVLPGFYKLNKHTKVPKEGDIIEALGRRDVSNRGETEVILQGDRASALEIYEKS